VDTVIRDSQLAHRSAGRKPHLSIVAPCYNEEACLPEFHRRVENAARAVVGDDYEIVLVNDGSRDRTWRVIQDLVAADPHLIAVNLSRNYGHQLALTAGLQICRGARILVIDSDLQDPPELLGDMMQRMDDGADVVYGRRRTRDGETWFKKTSARLFYRLLRRLIDVDVPADTGDFRLMSRRVLDQLNAMPEHYRFVRGLVSWIGFQQVPLDYDRDPRFAGETHYPLMLRKPPILHPACAARQFRPAQRRHAAPETGAYCRTGGKQGRPAATPTLGPCVPPPVVNGI
jgi:dolichol-phosphate mannosyltransferase